jgi:hypothetical protein
MNIHVHIEQLILEGLPVTRVEAAQVRAAVALELGRMLAPVSLSQLPRQGESTSAKTVTMNFGGGDAPGELGRSIARSVYRGLGIRPSSVATRTNRVNMRGRRL